MSSDMGCRNLSSQPPPDIICMDVARKKVALGNQTCGGLLVKLLTCPPQPRRNVEVQVMTTL